VVSVTVMDSDKPSDDQSVVIGLRDAGDGAKIDANASTVNIIIMAKHHVAGLLRFSQTNVTVSEGTDVFPALMTQFHVTSAEEVMFSSLVRVVVLICFLVSRIT